MIKIDFQEPNTPEWRAWRTKCDNEQSKLNAAVQAGRIARIKQSLYKGQKEQVYLHKDGPFHGKCAYCETNIYESQHGDIEHFRPKGAIKEKTGEPVPININGAVQEHPGYYWLAYSWDNLLPSCQLCNQPSTQRSRGRLIGKRDYFPVANFRATSPGEELQESPLLINPAQEDPGAYLALDSTGVLASVPNTGERGKTCIETFGLNDRDLPNIRAKVYKDVQNLVSLLVNLLANDPNSGETSKVYNRLQKIKAGEEPYTAAAMLAIRDMKNIVAAL